MCSPQDGGNLPGPRTFGDQKEALDFNQEWGLRETQVILLVLRVLILASPWTSTLKLEGGEAEGGARR